MPDCWWVRSLGHGQPSVAANDPLLHGQAVGCTQGVAWLWETRVPAVSQLRVENEAWLKWGEWASVWAGGPWGTWQPSPLKALSLASCQVAAPPPLLNHCHLNASRGTRVVGFSFLLQIPEKKRMVSPFAHQALQSFCPGAPGTVAWESSPPGAVPNISATILILLKTGS